MAIAWDEHKPPELDLIKDCVHCGFCLPTCPSYQVLENENDSPRGRIVLMRIGHEDGSEVSPQMTEHFDNCLGCMACVTACPSGVQYDRLIEQTRPQIERHGARTRTQRAYRRMIFELFTHPGRMRALAPLMALPADADVAAVRDALQPRPVVVLDGGAKVEDAWPAPPPGTLAVMARLKERFDPARIFRPGAYVGGI